MLTASQYVRDKQTILPDQVLEALRLGEGDAIVFEIDQAGVHLRKAATSESGAALTAGPQDTLIEWNSTADDEAYAEL